MEFPNDNELDNGTAVLLEFNLEAASPLYARERINRHGVCGPTRLLCATEDPSVFTGETNLHLRR